MRKSYTKIFEKRIKNLKYMIFFLNILILIIAFTVLLLLLWFNFNAAIQRNIEVIEYNYIYIGLYTLIFTTVFVLISAIFGCIVSFSLNYRGLNFFIITQVLIFILTFIGSVLLLSYSSDLQYSVEDRMNILLIESRFNLESQNKVDDIQKIVGCCGIKGIEDFTQYGLYVPKSCREPKTGNAYYYGCIDVLVWFFGRKTQWIIWLAMSMCLINIFNIVLTWTLLEILKYDDRAHGRL